VHGGKASEGRNASRESQVACERRVRKNARLGRQRWKRGEPQGRKRVATHASRQGGGIRRGGEKPRGRNVEEAGSFFPKEASIRATGGSLPGVDSLTQDDGGAIFGQTQERKLGRPGRKANGMGDHVGKAFCTSTGVRAAGPGRVGKDGAKVRRVERSSPIRMGAPRKMGPRRPRRWQPSPSKVKEGSCEGQRAAPSSCASPRVCGLRACTGKTDAEQEGSNPRWNGRSESNGGRLARGEHRRSETVSPRKRWFPPGRTTRAGEPCRPANPIPGPNGTNPGVFRT